MFWNNKVTQPSPGEIAMERRDIRSRWSESERARRRELAQKRQQQLLRILAGTMRSAVPAA